MSLSKDEARKRATFIENSVRRITSEYGMLDGHEFIKMSLFMRGSLNETMPRIVGSLFCDELKGGRLARVGHTGLPPGIETMTLDEKSGLVAASLSVKHQLCELTADHRVYLQLEESNDDYWVDPFVDLIVQTVGIGSFLADDETPYFLGLYIQRFAIWANQFLGNDTAYSKWWCPDSIILRFGGKPSYGAIRCPLNIHVDARHEHVSTCSVSEFFCQKCYDDGFYKDIVPVTGLQLIFNGRVAKRLATDSPREIPRESPAIAQALDERSDRMSQRAQTQTPATEQEQAQAHQGPASNIEAVEKSLREMITRLEAKLEEETAERLALQPQVDSYTPEIDSLKKSLAKCEESAAKIAEETAKKHGPAMVAQASAVPDAGIKEELAKQGRAIKSLQEGSTTLKATVGERFDQAEKAVRGNQERARAHEELVRLGNERIRLADDMIEVNRKRIKLLDATVQNNHGQINLELHVLTGRVEKMESSNREMVLATENSHVFPSVHQPLKVSMEPSFYF